MLLLLIQFGFSAPALAANPPNLVIFLADDLSRNDCSIYNPASGIRTPNMERVAREGMTFTHAFVASPSCAPSRGALLTGLSPIRNGAMFNHTVPDPRHQRWPAWFQELGYEVVAFGKVAHYATIRQYGFDLASHFNFHQDDCVEAAIAWLEKRSSRKPLCLFVGSNWPHVPWPVETSYPPETLPLPPTQVDTPQTRLSRARYAAAVGLADRDLGLVYDATRKHLGRDTLFLFSSDNGAQFPFGKWNCYDDGVHMPLVAVWPGQVAAGARSDAMVTWEDFLPTCLEAVGATPPPSGSGPGQITGRSFLPVLRGQRTEHRDAIFTTHSGDGKMNVYPIRALRTRDWDYILNLRPEFAHTTHIDQAAGAGDGWRYFREWVWAGQTNPAAAATVRRYHERPREELYDLRADPYEQRNLAAEPQHAPRLAEMRARLEAWLKSEGDQPTLLNEPRLLSNPSSYAPVTNAPATNTPASGRNRPSQPQPRS
jgi:N-sulfoglucosamine sulfohydrolase